MRKMLLGIILSVMATVLLVSLAGQPAVRCAMTPAGCQIGASLWARVCGSLLLGAVVLIVVVGIRVLLSIRCQARMTAQAMAPLLCLPAAPRPAGLVSLLRMLDLDARTQLVELDEPVAFCYGLAHPKLVLSTGLLRGLARAEVEAVLRHEQAHCRRRDPLRLALMRALAAALPRLRPLQRMAAALPVVQELAADRLVIEALGMEALGGALLKVGDAHGSMRVGDVAIGAFSAVDARLDQLLGVSAPPPLPRPVAWLPVVVLVAAGPILCLALPFSACAALVPALAITARMRRLRSSQ